MPLTTMTPLGQLSTFLAHGACVVNSGSPMVFTVLTALTFSGQV